MKSFARQMKKTVKQAWGRRPSLEDLKGVAASRWFRRTVMWGLIVFLLAFTILSAKKALHLSFVKLPSLEEQRIGVQVFDSKGKLVCTVRKDGDREPVALDQISERMQNAVIAVEDRNFYQHGGIDPWGIVRAVLSNVKAGELHEGGSTITQQLMKTMFFDFKDRTAKRKFFEVLMAIDVESCYSKKRILETYLNQVYFGRGAYGIERAASVYFNKSAAALNTSEAAFLAGLIKAPSDLGNPANSKKAKQRQQQVIKDMSECGYLSLDQAEKLKATALAFKSGPHRLKFPHYVRHVVGLLDEKIGEDKLWKQTIRVYTHLDSSAQAEAEKVLLRGVRKAPVGLDQGALVSINLEDGAVLAMVGSVGPYEKSQWNRALNPHTAGSAFKPFVYLAALVNGKLGPSSFVDDAPFTVTGNDGKAYTPQNYDWQFNGLMTVRQAIALSRNIPAVKVASDTGMRNVIEVARKAGISSEMDPVPALALGTCAVSPLEMANGYATIARGGQYMEPKFIKTITFEDGTVVAEFKTRSEKRLASEPCYQIIDALQDVITQGTGRRAALAGVPVAGKTGTADDSKDIWFVGVTPDTVTSVWA
ncbi:MAG: PBP1A family penicillin-binding protein, partial [Candidatus Obscuribacterales bacterium]|nr:PBP1A family penicillin-binding protein [Candidatus Obscuribacterales bacterium]